LDRDGTLDNDIIAHEWGHYISNRLVGNANGLNNNQGRSMGEGWADFHALLLNVRESDRARPGNDQWQGVYALATYTQSGGNNQGYYYGIRRVPYSTDFAKNALTFKHIANGVPLPDTHPVASGQTGRGNSEVHNAGEVWATMLWECYASLLNAYPFQEAQDRMKQYLVAAYKATPSSPTLLEARDALLAVAAASDPADHSRFLKAFARRGAGLGARGPERDSQDHIGVVESFERGNNLEVVSLRLDDGLVGCDQDGVLDVGETGSLQVTVRNTGASTLAAFSGTVSSSSTTATLEFPGGTTLSFPSLPPHATATRTLAVRLASVSDPAPRAGLTLTFDEPSLPASTQTAAYDPRIHYDEVLGTSATEDVEGGQTTAWTSTLMNRGEAAWTKQGGTGNGFFHAPNLPATADLTLTSPWMEVNPTGEFIVSFKHRWSFEASNGGGAPFWDGGVVELSIDGIEWLDVLELGHLPGYSDYLDDRSDNPLAGRPALVGLSPDYPAWRTETLNCGEVLAGYKVQFRFRLGSDGAVGAYGWDIDDISFTNVKNSPFGGLAPESSDGTVCNRRPVAHAGTNQSVKEGKLLASGALERTPITLDGSGSFDPDGQALSYIWTQVGGPAVTLSATDVARPTFVADVAWDSVLSFQLVTSDGQESSLPKRVDVAVQNVNRLPKAVPQAPASVVERSTERVTLDGSSSTDEDGETLTYKWTQVEGPSVLLDNPASATPSFALPEVVTDTQLTFSLVVNDGLQDS
ncbi:MAG TPA: M36 family metallopeptidase, partial [Myxococcaceae bacterium]|nr:M36 family metallopeptidase [Myxococcaceae bacterium]